jgi:uncharacterized membrane protein
MIAILPNWHPILVHFTIGLLFTSSALFVVGGLCGQKSWSKNILMVAYVTLWLGVLVTLGTVAAGIYAYKTVAHDSLSHLAMKNHRNWALGTAMLFIILALWSLKISKQGLRVGKLFLVVIVLASIGLSVAGYKGGELVYRYGVGVLPVDAVIQEGRHDNHEAHGH